MVITVKNEAPFQILTGAFTIGPSPTGYELQVGATPQSFTTLFSVGANTPRMVTNVANGSYFRMKNNVGDVEVNWQRTCAGGGGGGGADYTPGEYIDIQNNVISVTGITPDEYLTTADTQDFATKEFVTGATEEIYETMETKEEVVASALTELHNQVLEISGSTGGGNIVELTKAQYEALDPPEEDTLYIITDADAVDLDDYAPASGLTELSGTVQTINSNYATKQNVTARASNSNYLPGWNAQGVITGDTRIYSVSMTVNGTAQNNIFRSSNTALPSFYAPTSAGTAGQPLLSNGSGAPVWGGYKFAFITQTEYDALATKDTTTIYFITED